MKKEQSSLSVGLSFVGAVVGAGFISGQELVQFFIRFGLWGILGWIIMVSILTLGGSLLLEKIAEKKPESFDKVISDNFKGVFAQFVNLVTNGYLIGGLIIMVSGAATIISSITKLPLVLSICVVSLAIFLTIIGKGARILSVNKFLVPLLIFSTVLVTAEILIQHKFAIDLGRTFTINNPSPFLPNWILAVLLYLGYNTIGAIVAVINIGKEISPQKGKMGGRIGGLIVAFLGTMIMLALWVTYPQWQKEDMPIILIAKESFSWLYPVFVPSMIIAMFTVATAYALGLSKYASVKFKFNFVYTCLILLLIVAPISLLGFSKLLGMIYPFFGIMATLIMVYLVAKYSIKFIKAKIN